jgi:FlaA1/EpsC-like NDP-sugar epimerase
MVIVDLIALPLAVWSGFALRLSECWPEEYLFASWKLFLVLPIVGILVFMRLGLCRAIVSFMSVQAIWTVCKGVFLFALTLFSGVFSFSNRSFCTLNSH